MAAHNTTGKWGEEKAAAFLRAMGYDILERNWRCGHLELDIIARRKDVLAFVEVKTRRQEGEYAAIASVTPAKRLACAYAADAYLQEHPCTCSLSFDVVTVVGSTPETASVSHYENAFSPRQLLHKDQKRRSRAY